MSFTDTSSEVEICMQEVNGGELSGALIKSVREAGKSQQPSEKTEDLLCDAFATKVSADPWKSFIPGMGL